MSEPRAVPLVMYGVNNTTEDVVDGNLVATFERGYQPFQVATQYRGPVSIVGSGPSIAWTYKRLVGDVIACNSAHDFLIEHGVIPKYTMIWDANPVMDKIIKKPHKDVTYLIASRCHPSVFEKLAGYNVLVWHALGGSTKVQELLVQHKRNEPLIAGGSTSVTRATHVAGSLGYTREMHLFGIDSCYSEGKTHVTDSIVAQQKMNLRVCGKWFTVAPWMAMQAGDFKMLAPMMKSHGIRLIVHGTGLIPYVATFLDCETPDIRVSVFERMRREVHALGLLFLELRNSPQLLGGSNVAGVR